MAAKFECEVRYFIEDIKEFQHKMNSLGAKLVANYSFYDYYYKNPNVDWDHIKTNLRIRKWKYPTEPINGHFKEATKDAVIYFVKNEIIDAGEIKFKRSLFKEGKRPLYKNTLENCQNWLDSCGYEPWFVLKKEKAYFWKCQDFDTISELVENFGWTGELEFEGTSIEKAKEQIERVLKILEIPRELVSYKPLSVLYAEKNNLL